MLKKASTKVKKYFQSQHFVDKSVNFVYNYFYELQNAELFEYDKRSHW